MAGMAAASMAFSLSCLVVLVVGSIRLTAISHLGYEGATASIVVVSAGDSADRSSFAGDLQHFAQVEGVSVAYTPSANSASVMLQDRQHRFKNVDGTPLARFTDKASSRPVAILSSEVPLVNGVPSVRLPSGARMMGRFDPSVQVDGRYPVLILNYAALPYGSGDYMIAGLPRRETKNFLYIFKVNRMQMVRSSINAPASVATALAPPFGPIAGAFAALSVMAAYLTAQIETSITKKRLVLALAAGAGVSDMASLVARRLLPVATVGMLLGAASASTLALESHGLLSLGVVSVLWSSAASALMCSAILGMILAVVAWSSARRIAHELSPEPVTR